MTSTVAPLVEGSPPASMPRLVRAVVWYQQALDDRPSPCRFTPSCSTFAGEALMQHGTARGLWMTLRRLLRCRPFGPSGYDPVPAPSTATPGTRPARHTNRDDERRQTKER